MTDLEVEEILNGFIGNDQQDIEYFLSLSKKFKDDPDANHIYNAALQTLYKNLSSETKKKFVEELKEKGLGYLLKSSPVELHRLDKEDLILVKKLITGNLIGVKQTIINFDTAVLVGQSAVMSVPREVVEKLIQQRREWLEQNEIKE